jgi:hypothetical protein
MTWLVYILNFWIGNWIDADFKSPNCGLVFRHDSDVQTLGLATEDDKLRKIREVEDLSSFGRRRTPADVVEIQSEDEHASSPQPTATQLPIHQELAQPPQALSMQNLAMLHETAAEPLRLGIQPDLQGTKLASIDWNSGSSAMAARLNTSALPSTDLLSNGDNDPVKAEVDQQRQERKDLEALKRVHFTSSAPGTPPLRDRVKEYKEMPLDAQVHVRKVVDRFPNLAAYLAKRFANSNVSRMKRLRKGQLLWELEAELDDCVDLAKHYVRAKVMAVS